MDLPDASVLPPGTRIDQYVITSLLGRGGFGITYLVRDEALQKDFALKEFFPESLVLREGASIRIRSNTNSETEYRWGLRKFFDEARLLVQFNHPNIVSVRRVFEANNSAYMLLDFVDGSTLESWLRGLDSPPTQEELDTIVTPLLSALELVHRNRTWHLDFSPENVMIRRSDGVPVLLDFGASRLEIKQRSHVVSALVFKSGYSAPEQYTSKADRYGPWTDIYAVGATLYRAISGRLPSEAIERQLNDELEPARRVAKGRYRDSFLGAIDWAMQLKPEGRPQSIADWRKSLLEAEGTLVSQARPAVTGARKPAPRQIASKAAVAGPSAASRARVAWVLLLVALIAGGGLSIWMAQDLRCSLFGASCPTPASTLEIERLQACLSQKRASLPCDARSCLASFPTITPATPGWLQVGQILAGAEKACQDEDDAAARRARDCAAGKDAANAVCDIPRACIAPYLTSHPDGRARSELHAREQKAARACESDKLASQQAEDRLFDTALSCAAASDGCKIAVCFQPYLSAYPNGRHVSRAQTQIATARCAPVSTTAKIPNGTYLARTQQGCDGAAQSVRITIGDGRIEWQHDAQKTTFQWEGAIDASGEIRAAVRGIASMQANGRWNDADRWIEMAYPQCGKVVMTIYQMLRQ